MIKPTIGRVVWFTPSKGMDGRHDPAQPLAAIVCCVIDDRHVNLSVINQMGQHQGRLAVQLLQDDDPVPVRELTAEDEAQVAANPEAVIDRSVPYAQWMPYQLGQAKAAAAAP